MTASCSLPLLKEPRWLLTLVMTSCSWPLRSMPIWPLILEMASCIRGEEAGSRERGSSSLWREASVQWGEAKLEIQEFNLKIITSTTHPYSVMEHFFQQV